MRKCFVFAVIAAAGVLSGCSAAIGEEGKAFIAFSWFSISQVYTDDPSFGEIIYSGVYENANTGTWYFEYTSFDEYWSGTYTVYRNPGTFLYDGEDIYFELCLYSSGPLFNEWSSEYVYRAADINTEFRGDEYYETLSAGGYTVELNVCRKE